MERGGGGCWGWRFGVITLIDRGSYKQRVEMPISINTGGRAEVVLTQTLETGGGSCGYGSPRRR